MNGNEKEKKGKEIKTDESYREKFNHDNRRDKKYS